MEDSRSTQDFRQVKSVGALQLEVERLRRQLDARGGEIDALQVEAARRNKPWWREPATIVAVVALAISAVFSVMSRLDLSQADDQAKREKLTTLVQRLTAIQRETAANVRDSNKPGTPYDVSYYANVGSSLNTDRVMLARQAADLAESIPRLVTSVEFYAVAQELWQSGETTRALRLAGLSETYARNVQEYTAAVRERSMILYGLQRFDEARTQMKRALNVFTDKPEFGTENSPAQRAYLNLDTELKWASLELQAPGCEESTHLAAATKIIEAAKLPQNSPFTQQRDQIRGQFVNCPS